MPMMEPVAQPTRTPGPSELMFFQHQAEFRVRRDV